MHTRNEREAARSVVEEDLERLCQRLEAEFQALDGRRLLITGGGGFLGYYFVQAVTHWNRTRSHRSIQLTVVENGARGIQNWLRDLAGTPGFTLLLHDATTPLPAAVPELDYVVHAAGIASPTYYRQHPLETMDANVVGLRLLLEKARAQAERGRPLSGFLFLSSSEIYGDPTPENIPTPETYRGNVSCTGPRACYDESKRYGETLSVVFARKYGVPVTIARPFNNYGPGLRLHDGRVIPDFARCILEGRDIVMYSDGTPTRTFCYAADAVSGYYKVLVRGRAGEPYNIGVESPEISMRDLAELMSRLGRELFGYGGRVVLQKNPELDYLVDNPQRRCPVVAKARHEVGYAPEVPLEEGLRRSLLWYAGNREDGTA
ncbi:MAG TPA: NAD-dependent epimerase/dehydratase family protein [Gemmatimonadaceae bacterium]|nr:NAD-dependent epimerase/dehydratase family protein [Gemmatimonadaceae bacterium]